jgi:pyruvate dehydrogenase E2 component (dihydrolipoamide acetyltransferase)
MEAAENENPAPSDNGKKKDIVEEVKEEVGSVPVLSHEVATSESRIKASPLAKSIAAEAGISLGDVEGSGDYGRIIKRDIENYLKSATIPVVAPKAERVADPKIEFGDHGISQMRKVIARRLGESKFSSPHFYLTIEINMDNAAASRKAINNDPDIKVSFNDYIVKASAMALRKHPMVNASWFGDKITVHRDINIGVAVAVAEGLLVPVINNADNKSFTEINKEVKVLAGLAKERKLQPEQMQGNTFTISNLGMFGIEEFTAIINPPDACILAVGAIIDKPIVESGEIKSAKMMKVTLSCDHRIVDGATGAQFLNTLKKNLENPVNMLV